MRGSRLLILGLAIAGAVAAASPAVAENALRFTGMDAGAGTLDPHFTTDPDNKGATKQVYEALLDIDSNLAIVLQLALAWKVVDLHHWEFELRPDVRFHDGTPFTAEDVIFSLERARAETSGFRGYVEGIAAAEVIDDHTVRFTTTEPDPSLWLKLAEIPIMSEVWTERHDVGLPAFEEGYASRHGWEFDAGRDRARGALFSRQTRQSLLDMFRKRPLSARSRLGRSEK